jgi:hypothetical protein
MPRAHRLPTLAGGYLAKSEKSQLAAFWVILILKKLQARDAALSALRIIFERLFDRNHIIRQNICFLDTIESVCIIQGKA